MLNLYKVLPKSDYNGCSFIVAKDLNSAKEILKSFKDESLLFFLERYGYSDKIELIEPVDNPIEGFAYYGIWHKRGEITVQIENNKRLQNH